MEGRDGSENGPEKGPDDRRTEGGADEAAAAAGRRSCNQPCERARPRERARHTLEETREVECPDRVGESERDRCQGEQGESDQHGSLDAEAGGGDSARDPRDQGARGVHGLQHAGAGLPEPQLVDVVRKQRCQRREEHRVDEDDGTREEKQPAHGRVG